jgi:inorganic pyrophosphatase
MEILVYVEISKNSRIKYEFNKDINMLICDRILPGPFSFPFNYGFIPNTLSGDGDPLDVIIYMDESLVPNSLIKCIIIGALETIDEKGEDIKLICVPAKKVSYNESHINSITDLPKHFMDKIIYFYTHYKDLEEGKYVKIGNILDKDDANIIYNKSILNK